MVISELCQHGSFAYQVWSRGGGRALEFCSAMNMTAENTFFKKRVSHLNVSSLVNREQRKFLKGLIDVSSLVKREQRKFLKGIKEVLPSEHFIIDYFKTLVF